MTHNIEVDGGKTVKLPTAGKYCDRDIIVSGKGHTDADMEAKYTEGYNEGYNYGFAYGYGDESINGYHDGMKAEYDKFWDTAQQNGTRTNYEDAFGRMWTDVNFKPKYLMVPLAANRMFQNTMVSTIKAGVVDFSQCTGMNYIFGYGYDYLKAIEVDVDTRNISTLTGVFYYSRGLHTIKKIILKDDGSQTFPNTFGYNDRLENIVVEGTIGQNGLNLQHSTKLSRDSIASFIYALSDTTSGLSITLSKKAVDNAFETAEGAADGSSSWEWATYTGTKPNWTFNLV